MKIALLVKTPHFVYSWGLLVNSERIRSITLSIPIDVLIDNHTNVYELTCVAISLSNILCANRDKEMESNNKKVVSTVLERVLTENVEFTVIDKE